MRLDRAHCEALDAADPLRRERARYALPPGVIYLDGNSLGPPAQTTAARVQQVIEREWGEGLIRSWNAAGWIDLPQRVGEKIAALIGAAPGQVLCTDSTSINLFKVLASALALQARRDHGDGDGGRGRRRVILSEEGNFPTDLYMAQGLVQLLGAGLELRLAPHDAIAAAIEAAGADLAVLLLTEVNFQTGARHDMAALTRAAHVHGALVIWDLAHSAGALPLALDACDVDFAVGCGYKYLNGGPGAPAFVYAAERQLAALAQLPFAQPLCGWLGHAAPFEFTRDYRPAHGIGRFATGTPSILALAALEAGVDSVQAAGIAALRTKSLALSDLLIALVQARCGHLGLQCVTPLEHARRGSQVSFTHAHAWPVMQALIARGVIGDFRAPDVLRFGLAPAYLGFTDLWDAVQALHDVLEARAWDSPRFHARNKVT